MKKETLEKRLSKRYKGNKTRVEYLTVKELLDEERFGRYVEFGIIRPCVLTGKGRFTSLTDYSEPIENMLNLLGVKYEKGNDAPRGGRVGDFIKPLNISK